jgi:hypothetical protein
LTDTANTDPDPEPEPPVVQTTYRTTYQGRELSLTILDGERGYQFHVDGHPRGQHTPDPALLGEGALDLRSDTTAASALAVLAGLIDTEDRELRDAEDGLRVMFPLHDTVRIQSSRSGKYLVGTVVGHEPRRVSVRITETTYTDPSTPWSKVGNVVRLPPDKIVKTHEPYPEHARWEKKKTDPAVVAAREFLEWLRAEYVLWHDHVSNDELLARWQGIDPTKIETEDQAMLTALRRDTPQPKSIDHEP